MKRRILALCLPMACIASAWAQHPPLTARTDMPVAPAVPAPPAATATGTGPAPATAAAHRPAAPGFGQATRALFQMQAEGTHAGPPLPMLGETASRSYQRYLDSFDHPIPEYFDAALPSSTGSSTR
ncbi:DUF3613 domain-containing protein [Stenotrophomonas mori]|uniref:DUF3613 domain-containing protein n=1 Tax=Stenotrophomonas mori TaxID=2871096 RepID=A0ABT0SDX2_9GAMM|nr:DUF3613 domain-containing protein [Stenotrophomonas mori]MCL7713506.1 DUF3613 domain-containing protein [Stenotrophomonas mori]